MTEYINKDEALAIIENRQREICPMGRYSRNAVYGSDREAFDNWEEILDEIEAIPSADVAPVRHARWGVEVGMNFFKERNCPVCKKRIESNFWNFCPNCGADMRGINDE